MIENDREWLKPRGSLKDCTSQPLQRLKTVAKLERYQPISWIKGGPNTLPFVSIFIYAFGSCNLTSELWKRTQAFEMNCYRRLLNIPVEDNVSNVED